MKINYLKLWTLVGLVILAIVAILAAFISDQWGMDELERIEWDTKHKLAEYERSDNPSEVRKWVTNTPGDALTQQIHITLGDWSITHRKAFTRLVESISTKDQERFIEDFSFAIDDSGQTDEFLGAYRGNKSKIILLIVHRLGRSVPWSK